MNPLDFRAGSSADLFVAGLVPGIVTNNKDPDGLGRVKVVLPLLGVDSGQQGGDQQGVETDWAPVLSFAAGNGRGGYFLPEIKDEVLVAFLLGDVNRPFVVGASWNGQDKPPQTNGDGKNNMKQITTRSGNTLLFDDTDGAAKIQLFDKDGKDEIVLSAKDNTISIKSEKAINLTSANGVVTIQAKSIKVEAQSDLSMSAKTISIKSSGSLSLEGSSVELKSNGMVSVKGSIINLN
jgi:uncharacterized protein involved in type VI secretion and phage assembly